VSIPRLIGWLATLCLSASWVALMFSLLFGRVVTETSGIGLRFLPYETSITSALRCLSIVCAFGSGALAVFRGGFGVVSLSARTGYVLAAVTSLTWMVLTYGWSDLRSIVLGPTSPVIWLMLVAVFAGALPTTWEVLDRTVKVLCVATIPLAVWFIFNLRGSWRCEGLNPVTISAILLTWFSAYLWLISPPTHSLGHTLRWIGTALAFGAALCSQSRGWMAQLFLLGILVLIGNNRFASPESRWGWATLLRTTLIAVVSCAAAVWVLRTIEPEVVDKLVSRLTEDTRSEQYRHFFAQVDPLQLIAGKGPNASYRFGSNPAYQYFDNGFIWMLFIAGLPMLLAYGLLVILPGFLLVLKARDRSAFGVGALLVMWTAALAGVSTFNGINGTFQACLMMYVAGLCHLKLSLRPEFVPAENAEPEAWPTSVATEI